jgi:hypothetical protein
MIKNYHDNHHFDLKIKNNYHAILECEDFKLINNTLPSRWCQIVKIIESHLTLPCFDNKQILVAMNAGYILFFGHNYEFQYHEFLISPHETNNFIFDAILIGDIVLLKTKKCNTSMNIVLDKKYLFNQYGFNKIQFYVIKNLENDNIKYVYFNNKKILFIDDKPIELRSRYKTYNYPDFCDKTFEIYLRTSKGLFNLSNNDNSDENLVELKLFEKHL